MNRGYKNTNFKQSLNNFVERFGFWTGIVFALLFFLFNLVEFGTSDFIQRSDVQFAIYGFVFPTVFFLALTILSPNMRKQLISIWTNNKYVRGYKSFASYFGVFFVLSFLFSGLEGTFFNTSLNTDVVSGLLATKTLLVIYYLVIASFETLLFAILVPIMFREWAKSELWGDVYTSIIFSFYHGYRYNWYLPSMIFAFIVNFIFIKLVWKKEIRGISTTPMVIAGHQIYDLASLGALLYIYGG